MRGLARWLLFSSLAYSCGARPDSHVAQTQTQPGAPLRPVTLIRLKAAGAPAGFDVGMIFRVWAAKPRPNGEFSQGYYGSYTDGDSRSDFGFRIYPGQEDLTAQSLAVAINRDSLAPVTATHLGAGILAFVRKTADPVWLNVENGASQIWQPALPTAFSFRGSDPDAMLIKRGAGIVTVPTLYPHGFTVGQAIYFVTIDADPLYGAGPKIVTSVPDAQTFCYSEIGPDGAFAGFALITSAPDYRTAFQLQ